MYKIYVNETLLRLKETAKLKKDYEVSSKEILVAYPGNSKYLYNYIDLAEKSTRIKRIIIHHDDRQLLKEAFLGMFKIITAAGGLVINSEGKALVIFRRGFWDLPKGKIESGETKKKAAKREVKEETGIKSVRIIRKLGITHHMYRNPGKKREIKKSHWYLMNSNDVNLIPQVEEDIVDAQWMDIQELLDSGKPIYRSIRRILKQYLKNKDVVTVRQ
jgi:ADP-ribose pyrophosphatase YjhB (NUDIX family)